MAKSKIQTQYEKASKLSLFSLVSYFFIAIFFLFALTLMFGIFYISKDLPSVESLKTTKSSFTTRIYSSDGRLINNYATENRIFVPIDEIPDDVKNAFISAEDSNFYSHGGIDFLGILKAVYKNAIFFTTGKGQLVGASTITQQVVKNLLLNNEKTLIRKLKEAILAIEISKAFSKDEVLEIYLNHIYLGSGAYGVYASALEYFGKNLNELEIEEIALLAAMPKAPSEINPRRRKDRAKARRDWVLKQMLDNFHISNTQYLLAKEKDVRVINHKNVEKYNAGSNAFADYVKSQTSGLFGTDAFFSNGLFIQTTMNYKVQQAFFDAFREGILTYDKKMGYRGNYGTLKMKNPCEELNKFIETAENQDYKLKYAVILSANAEGLLALNENCEEFEISAQTIEWTKKPVKSFQKGEIIAHENATFSQFPEVNGGAMVLDAKSGSVLAMIGDFYDRPNAFNRAIYAKRQLGSAVKPFVYLTALENGFAPNSILVDENLKLSDEWQPRNASRDFLGSVTLRVSLERSRNVPTVRIAEILGVAKIIKRLKEIGLNADEMQNDLTTALGSLSVTVERVAKSASIFVNGGRKLETAYIEKIQNAEGKTIFSKAGDCVGACANENSIPIFRYEKGEKIAGEESTFQILSMLEGAVQRGTSSRLKELSPFGIGGKTGTTSDYKDAWSLVLTNDLIIVLYIGNDKPKTLGEGQYGAVLAVPIVKEALKKIFPEYPPSPFLPPDSLIPIEIDYQTGDLPAEKSTRKIVEYFKDTDKKPKAVRGASSVSGQVSEEEDVLGGVY